MPASSGITARPDGSRSLNDFGGLEGLKGIWLSGVSDTNFEPLTPHSEAQVLKVACRCPTGSSRCR